MTGYDYARQWWDFAFENPEKVTPNHAALYFFAIEHCNRLGWKDKFGFPMEMAKDAIGIKNYRTYSKTFNDLVDWGFFIVHQKSKNQYSANVIALAENTKATTKALSKAMQKHSQKQVHGIVGIDKHITKNNEDVITSSTWRDDFQIYLAECKKAFSEVYNDKELLSRQQVFHPNVNIQKTIWKAYENFWGTEAGWKHKKKNSKKDIDWKHTIINAIDINKVYYTKQELSER